MSEIRPEGLVRQQLRRHYYPQDFSDADADLDADVDTTFPATYCRVSHLGRQPGPLSSFSSSSSSSLTNSIISTTIPTTTTITTILGRQTEEPYLSRILLDACLKVYNENHSIGKFVLDLSDALDQASCEIARGHAIYYDQVEFKWWEPEPTSSLTSPSSSSLMRRSHSHHHHHGPKNYVAIPWVVARPRHLIAKYNLLKLEFDAILVDCEMEANISGGGGGFFALAATLAATNRPPPSSFTTTTLLRPAYHHHHHHNHPQHQQHNNNEPSATNFFQMLASEPTRDFLLELKAWTADMRAFIVEETSKTEKRSVDLSRLRQVRPGR